MARIELNNIAHRYPGQRGYALAPLDVVFRDGGAYALLGPSGCGKTTLLNIISGLVRPSEGSISIADRDVTGARTEVRNIAQVFQFPVIYDTMTVFDNLAFPLRNRGADEPSVRRRVQEIAGLLELSGDLHKRASGLTAEFKQRISLGRGLVRRDVGAILLDEPLTVIDPHVKWLLRRKLMQVHAELGVTLIYVTHDQTEALTLADQVLVMSEGKVLQQGTPEELFERPAHTFVGYFIGSPGMNILPCAVEGGRVSVAGQRVRIANEAAARAVVSAGKLELGIRPEFVRMSQEPRSDGARGELVLLAAHVVEVEQHGHARIVFVQLDDMPSQRVAIKLPGEGAAWAPGAACQLELPSQHTILYAGGRALG